MDQIHGEQPTGKDRFGMDWSGIKGTWFWKSPHFNRRNFFRHLGSAIGGYFLLPGRPMESIAQASVTPIGKAKNVIFVMMSGAPSHVDTFDLKEGSWLPKAFDPTSYGEIRWPRGLFPNLAEQLDSIALVRSMKPWAAVHELARTWVQIGRNPVSGLARIAPHIGSVVSLELAARSVDKTLPPFFNLNASDGPGAGYLPPGVAPFYFSPGGNPPSGTTHPDGLAAFTRRSALLDDLDGEMRSSGLLGAKGDEMTAFNASARQLMYRSEIDSLFRFSADERARFGNTGFGNALIVARNLLAADKGTRFVQVNLGGWDNHANIYTGALNPTNANSLARQFDTGMGALLADMKASGLLDDTLVIAMGEFGRTTGMPNMTSGRDHYLQQSALIAGAGVKGKRSIGTTDASGGDTSDPGWSRERSIRPEDIEATIYSALGIDWTTVRRDDPFNRGFEYVPFSDQDLYGPVHELWQG
ncbi:DUF1501 domain-containing protein [Bryobacter aggregatus]|uniref:DUF1501 domain-containing protein n=1 Tax=Bryobacter aggregatus TaxID=360054 RepID=UPI0004E1AA06|nr:DUF1501 domain-containing protein [Bryobacter aggregatus]